MTEETRSMWNYLWPALLIVGGNVCYHLLAKVTPAGVNPFVTLSVTYLVAAAACFALSLAAVGAQGFAAAVRQVNWTGWLLGIVIVALEFGSISLYRAGWDISVGSLVTNIALAVCLLVVGLLFFRETLNPKQLLGALLCVGGLVLLNLK
jgi:drug/metabolite transporter (DMT)-like permease